MRLLLDTRALIWVAFEPAKLSAKARRRVQDVENELYFSVVSLWEIGVKRSLKRGNLDFDPHVLRAALLLRGFIELPLSGEHALAVDQLPALHGDPFDRILLCQTLVEGLTLVTNDDVLLKYPVSTMRA